ncbi:PadR family transcriptional regulator [Kutzneria sp. NPDC052558]|uniref:PadR family transcriptional regulator n=1 Tax=Kutzneria sp. NPDC052558 TaxID=3364121 RepID=UPI0037CB9291
MSLRHALIGLLRERPASGYDLMNVFDKSLRQVWPATKSQVYAELAKLDEAGLIEVTAEGPRGRREYAPTEAGLAELRHWLLETVPDQVQRSETLLRVFLLGAVDRAQAKEFMLAVRERTLADLARLDALANSIDWERDDDPTRYGVIVMEWGRRMVEMTRDWSEWAATRIPD